MIWRELPGVTVDFQAADIVSQVLNFGLSAPIDVHISGQQLAPTYDIARRLEAGLRGIPGLADVRIPQVLHYPQLRVDVDRVKELQLRIDQRSVAPNLLS